VPSLAQQAAQTMEAQVEEEAAVTQPEREVEDAVQEGNTEEGERKPDPEPAAGNDRDDAPAKHRDTEAAPSEQLGTDDDAKKQGTSTQRYRGRVKSYNSRKGFGFLEMPGYDRDIFVYTIHLIGRIGLIAGEAVEFEIVYDAQRPQARRVKAVANPQQAAANPEVPAPPPLAPYPEEKSALQPPAATRSTARIEADIRAAIQEAQQRAIDRAPKPGEQWPIQSSSNWTASEQVEVPGARAKQEPQEGRIPNGSRVTILPTAVPLPIQNKVVGGKLHGKIESYDPPSQRYAVRIEEGPDPEGSDGETKTSLLYFKADQMRAEAESGEAGEEGKPGVQVNAGAARNSMADAKAAALEKFKPFRDRASEQRDAPQPNPMGGAPFMPPHGKMSASQWLGPHQMGQQMPPNMHPMQQPYNAAMSQHLAMMQQQQHQQQQQAQQQQRQQQIQQQQMQTQQQRGGGGLSGMINTQMQSQAKAAEAKAKWPGMQPQPQQPMQPPPKANSGQAVEARGKWPQMQQQHAPLIQSPPKAAAQAAEAMRPPMQPPMQPHFASSMQLQPPAGRQPLIPSQPPAQMQAPPKANLAQAAEAKVRPLIPPRDQMQPPPKANLAQATEAKGRQPLIPQSHAQMQPPPKANSAQGTEARAKRPPLAQPQTNSPVDPLYSHSDPWVQGTSGRKAAAPVQPSADDGRRYSREDMLRARPPKRAKNIDIPPGLKWFCTLVTPDFKGEDKRENPCPTQ
ncbi:conserved hypothetical cold shock domain, partial [Amphidinium carterae]